MTTGKTKPPVSLRLLGLAGMLTAPFFWLETHFYNQAEQNSSLTGLCDLLYMLGWSCSIVGLVRLRAAGEKPLGKWALYLQLAFLSVANVWNTWVVADPLNDSLLFKILDAFWPISNIWMLVTGIAVIRAGRLPRPARFVPLLAGFWLPVTMLSGMLLPGGNFAYYLMVSYSLLSFFLLGLLVFLQPAPAESGG